MNNGNKWIKTAVIGILSLFFLIFGVDALIASYRMENPLEFVLAFFSSNLVICISVVGLIHAGIKAYSATKKTDQCGEYSNEE